MRLFVHLMFTDFVISINWDTLFEAKDR